MRRTSHTLRGATSIVACVAALAAIFFALLASASPAWAQGAVMFDTKGVSDKPQSKLWYVDDYWWACLNNATNMALYRLEAGVWVHKLNLQAAVTPVAKGGTCDVLWDGTNLFIAVFGSTTSKIYKLDYDPLTATYSVLSGFPVSISMRLGAETIVIAKDSTNRLYITYEAENKIYVQWTTSGDHRTWYATPLSIAAPVDADDISTIFAFGGNRIGVAWTDQRSHQVGFRVHRDGDAPNIWESSEVVRAGFGVIDDHLNMQADSQGRVYLVGKDYWDAVWLARRNLDGTWTLATGASGLDCGTRPIVQIDEANNKLYVFYTRWAECVSTGTHKIEERVSYLDNLLFSLPAVVISASSTVMNEVQGTKQMLPPGSLAILCEGNGKAYWRGWGPVSGIGGTDPGGVFPPPPLAPTNLVGTTYTEPVSSRTLLFRMDEGAGNKTDDASGNSHDLTFGTGIYAPVWTSGLVNGGLYFNGDNYASTGGLGLQFVDTPFTLESWVKLDLTNAPGTGMLFARGDSVHSNYELSITGDLLTFEWSMNDTASVSVKATGPFEDGAWHHVAAVYDTATSQGRLYIDGVLKTTKIMEPPFMAGGWPLTVGGLVNGGVPDKTFVGTLDLMAIADRVVYTGNFTPPLLYPTSSKRYVRLTWNPSSSEAGILGYKVYRSVNAGAPVDMTLVPTPNRWFADFAPPDGWVDYTVHAVDGITQQGGGSVVQVTWESNPPAVPTAPLGLAWSTGRATVEGPAFWEFDEGGGSVTADGTGLGHTARLGGSGTADSAEPAWDYEFSGNSLLFDGSNDYVQIEDANDLRMPSSYTVELWARRDRLNASGALLNKDAGSSKRNYGINFLSDGTVEFSWSRPSGSTRRTNSTVKIIDSNWHHIACVFDAGAAQNRIYIDGEPAGSSDVSGTPYTGSEVVLLGARTPGSLTSFYRGGIDLVRITNRILYTGAFTPPTLYRGGPQRHVVSVTWGLPASGLVEDYRIYRQLLPSGTNTLMATLDAATPVYTDLTAEMTKTYRYTVRARNSDNDEGPASAPLDVTVPGPTDVAGETVPLPPGRALRIEPNPFNPTASVHFRLDSSGPVLLELYDARGRRLDTLVRGAMPAGDHRVPLLQPGRGLQLASGVYFVRLRADGRDTRVKAVLVK